MLCRSSHEISFQFGVREIRPQQDTELIALGPNDQQPRPNAAGRTRP
jgi:hypothetical protein